MYGVHTPVRRTLYKPPPSRCPASDLDSLSGSRRLGRAVVSELGVQSVNDFIPQSRSKCRWAVWEATRVCSAYAAV